jgi:hypothetical protein
LDPVLTSRPVTHLENPTDVLDFQCAEPELENFLKRDAVAFEKNGVSRTYLLRRTPADPAEYPAVLGYYTLSMARVTLSDLPDELLPKGYPQALPAALLGRLARDARVPKTLRIGELLVGDALGKILEVERTIGCALVVLDAMNDRLVQYYEQTFGFRPIKRAHLPQKMVLPLSTIREAL